MNFVTLHQSKDVEIMIKNLLFDLGGVIMDLKRSRCVEEFRRLGMADADDFFDEYKQKGPLLKMECGEIGADEFRRQVREFIAAPVTDAMIDRALLSFLDGIPESRLDQLRALRRQYRVYMLSNTNPLMWEGYILPEFRKQGQDVNAYFDGVVTSFRAGVCKPDRRIFDYTVETLGIVPEETLFFDDSAANTEAASRLGFHTAHVKDNRDFASYIVD